ncbi:MAG: hypothetical protein V4443_08995 [Pseudomonadota bacterium]
MRLIIIAASGSMLLVLMQGCGHKGSLFLPPSSAPVTSGQQKNLPQSAVQPSTPLEPVITPSSPTTPMTPNE